MKITNLGVANTSLPSSSQIEDAAVAAADQVAQGAAAGAPGYSPSPELLQLIHLVRQLPDVRDEHVRAASGRLAQGLYHSLGGAAQTATAMLNALD